VQAFAPERVVRKVAGGWQAVGRRGGGGRRVPGLEVSIQAYQRWRAQ